MDTVTVLGSRSLFRAGLVSLLRSIGFKSIQEADDVQHLRSFIDAQPLSDLLIVGLVQGIKDVIDAVSEIRALVPTAKVVLVAAELDLDVLRGCFAAGTSGYVLEGISSDALRESLKLVNAGEKVFPSELAALFSVLMSKIDDPEAGHLALRESDLSDRELEILRCLTNGQSNKAIANNLDIAEATVKVHVKRILRKAHVANRTQAALWGVATGVAVAPPLPKLRAK